MLSPSAAQRYYDWVGKKQDSQGFYENPATADLIAHAGFEEARSVFEFGCGTGKFAALLLEKYLPPTATYFGCDISPVMIGLARSRVEAYAERAQVVLSDAGVEFQAADCSIDRVVSNYVLDLLSEADTGRFFSEASRVLVPGGRVCLASLTTGAGFLSRTVSHIWTAVFRLNPAIVGGCRPIRFDTYVDPGLWQVAHRRILAPFAVASEVLILMKRGTPDSRPERGAPPPAIQPERRG